MDGDTIHPCQTIDAFAYRAARIFSPPMRGSDRPICWCDTKHRVRSLARPSAKAGRFAGLSFPTLTAIQAQADSMSAISKPRRSESVDQDPRQPRAHHSRCDRDRYPGRIGVRLRTTRFGAHGTRRGAAFYDHRCASQRTGGYHRWRARNLVPCTRVIGFLHFKNGERKNDCQEPL